jgi:CheY-like chemotaxis protein
MISMMLKQQKHRVTVAENGEVAIQKIMAHWDEHEKGYDIVLMDLQMPVLDGLEATRRYRRLENEKNQQAIRMGIAKQQGRRFQTIVGMSANSDQDTVGAAFAAGVNDFIQKPFQMETFNIVAKKLVVTPLPPH